MPVVLRNGTIVTVSHYALLRKIASKYPLRLGKFVESVIKSNMSNFKNHILLLPALGAHNVD